MEISHLIGQSAEDLLVMGIADARSDHVPQVPQHGHKRKRLIVCTAETLLEKMYDFFACIYTQVINDL